MNDGCEKVKATSLALREFRLICDDADIGFYSHAGLHLNFHSRKVLCLLCLGSRSSYWGLDDSVTQVSL